MTRPAHGVPFVSCRILPASSRGTAPTAAPAQPADHARNADFDHAVGRAFRREIKAVDKVRPKAVKKMLASAEEAGRPARSASDSVKPGTMASSPVSASVFDFYAIVGIPFGAPKVMVLPFPVSDDTPLAAVVTVKSGGQFDHFLRAQRADDCGIAAVGAEQDLVRRVRGRDVDGIIAFGSVALACVEVKACRVPQSPRRCSFRSGR